MGFGDWTKINRGNKWKQHSRKNRLIFDDFLKNLKVQTIIDVICP